MDMLKKASESVCTSTTVAISWLLVSYSITSATIKTPENTEEDPDDP
jgi:hypothetical protein